MQKEMCFSPIVEVHGTKAPQGILAYTLNGATAQIDSDLVDATGVKVV